GQTSQYDASFIGYNSRLDSIQAAILLAKLKYIDKLNALRRKFARSYDLGLKGIKGIKTPFVPKASEHVYHLYSLKVSSKRDQLLNYLNSKGISSRVYYPVPLHKMKAFKTAKSGGSLKASEDTAKKILSLPIHPFLSDRQVEYVTSTIKRFHEKSE
ncbi:MAG: DegT/DnrJ/EryC1/StrS family aminotransferase, partial [Candidatus Omnitrophica bacterium]|nr:DegT/DnrJ/EryC1/StrS family aminotransferase [Candidatus Omnitrophota bacterium]